MQDWPDQKIQIVALRYIRKHADESSLWRAIRLETAHREIEPLAQLAPDECPIVSRYQSEANWYLLTSRRVLGAAGNSVVNVPALRIKGSQFGDFKGRDADTAIMALEHEDGRTLELEYETGSASMAPIHYFTFWRLKFPALYNLKI